MFEIPVEHATITKPKTASKKSNTKIIADTPQPPPQPQTYNQEQILAVLHPITVFLIVFNVCWIVIFVLVLGFVCLRLRFKARAKITPVNSITQPNVFVKNPKLPKFNID